MKAKKDSYIISHIRRYKNFDPEGIFLCNKHVVDFGVTCSHIKLGGFEVYNRNHISFIPNNLPLVSIYTDFSFMGSRNREFAICNGNLKEYLKYIITFNFCSLYSNVL
jgi:hypothetical protein